MIGETSTNPSRPSAITPELLGRRLRFGDVQWGQGGRRLVWLEGRSGRGVLVQSLDGGAAQDLTHPEHNLRGHWGYGGGEFCAGSHFVLYSEKDGRLYRQDYDTGWPQPLTPVGLKVCAAVLSPDEQAAVCVAAEGDDEFLALVSTEAGIPLVTLARGADFYMQPAWSPDGRRLAWVEWDHPGLPWEGCRLMLAGFYAETKTLGPQQQIAGGSDVPVFQPAFSPDGRWLAFISETGEWESLYLLDLLTGEQHTLLAGQVLSQPAWEQGLRMFAWQADSRSIIYTRLDQAHASLWRVSLGGSTPERLSLNGYTWLDHLCLAPDGRIACVASAAHLPPQVIAGTPGGWKSLRSGQPDFPQEELVPARTVSWKAADGTSIYGLFSAPLRETEDHHSLPPAIIFIHGGPTTQRFARFEVERSYFTSRGYAWMDVDYRGSTGYGRSYRRALYQNWGVLDVEDVLSAVQALVDQSLAHPDRLALYGSSAGGFTLLNVMIRKPGAIKAGLCLYPVSDLLKNLSTDFKLEKHYHSHLLGELPEAEEVYRHRSPLTHAGKLADPLALFHGMEDPVVPVEQSQAIANALQAGVTPCELHLYTGEGHGFRKAETVADMYRQMEKFLHLHLRSGAGG